MNNKIDRNYKYYKYTAIIFSLISFSIFTLKLFGISHPFFDGFAVSFIIIAALIGLKFYMKRKDPDYKEELYIKDNDERLLQIRYKRNSRMSSIMIYEIAILLGVSVFYDFSFKLGGAILIYSQIVVGLVLVIVDRRKQNG